MIGAPTIVSPSRRSLNSPPRYILRDPQTSLTSRPVSLLPNGTYISLMEGLSISSPARKSCSSSSFSSAAPYLPTELIHHIFAYLASPDLSMKCRPLNTRFSAIAERILTRRFRMKLSGLETQFKTASEQCDLVQRTLGPHLTHYRQFLRGVDVGDIKEAAWYSNPPAGKLGRGGETQFFNFSHQLILSVIFLRTPYCLCMLESLISPRTRLLPPHPLIRSIHHPSNQSNVMDRM